MSTKAVSNKRKTSGKPDAASDASSPKKTKSNRDATASHPTFDEKRMRILTTQKEISPKYKRIVYWMWRDQRVQDNWALIYAQKLAIEHGMPLHVCFTLPATFRFATIRQYGFMLKGLEKLEKELQALDISFHLFLGEPSKTVPTFLKSHHIGGLIVDFSPLREARNWLEEVLKTLPKDVPLFQVDAHNIVPCWEASTKLETAARTIRPKITKQLSTFLTEFPPCIKHPHAEKEKKEDVNWKEVYEFIKVDQTVEEVSWAEPGTEAGLQKLKLFCQSHLKNFAAQRNDPTKSALSNLSPWFHSGQISVQRAILSVSPYKGKYKESVEAFIEEAVIRRELADNFCFYNEHYDTLSGASEWAKKTLKDHAKDKREYVYSREQFETGKTHDNLWNAAQFQVVREGKMHGFLRMYWAKKILEWSKTPEDALDTAIYLNDKYQLDGNDPNGFVGCMWSVCGVHDQGWAERPIFGKIRYMNYAGCKKKFDVAAFIDRYK